MLLLALLSLLFCLLSFSGYRDPHVLPSFPTRRSSDLSFIVPPILSWYSEPGAIAPGKQVETICDPAYMIRYTSSRLLRGQLIGATLGALLLLYPGVATARRRGAVAPQAAA